MHFEFNILSFCKSFVAVKLYSGVVHAMALCLCAVCVASRGSLAQLGYTDTWMDGASVKQRWIRWLDEYYYSIIISLGVHAVNTI